MHAVTQPRLGKRKLPPPSKKALPRRARRPDWDWIRAEWEADLRSDRQLAAQSTAAGRKVSHNAIGKRAREESWKKKPLTAKMRQEVERRLAAAGVPTVPGQPPSEAQLVDAAASQGVEVIRQHRSTLGKTRSLTEVMLDELAGATTDNADLKAFVEQVTQPAKDATKADVETLAQRRQRLMRMIGLQSRANVLGDLTRSLRNLVGMERRAFNLDDESATPDSIEERLMRLEQTDAAD